MLFRSHNRKQHRSMCVFIVCHFLSSLSWRRKCVCHGSTISSADFPGKLNHAHQSWPTLSIVWLRLRTLDLLRISFTTNHNKSKQVEFGGFKRGFHPTQRTQRNGRNAMTSLLDRPTAGCSGQSQPPATTACAAGTLPSCGRHAIKCEIIELKCDLHHKLHNN